MQTLFYVAAVLFVSAIAVTLHAIFHAREGFEDNEGFHAVTHDAPEVETREDAESKLPPFLSAR